MTDDIRKNYMPEAAIPGFDQALAQIRAGSVDGAMHQLKSLISSYGDHKTGEIRSVLCQLEIHTGKFRQALRLAEELSGEFPERTYYTVLEAQCLYLLEKNASALKKIRSIHEIHDAYENYAIVYSAILNLNGMKSKTVEPFREALKQWKERDPESMEPVDRQYGLVAGCDILGYEIDDDYKDQAEKDLKEYLHDLDQVETLNEKASENLAKHISDLSSPASSKDWSRKLLKELADFIGKKGLLSDHPETMNEVYFSIEYHEMDEDPKALIALKECFQAFNDIDTHQQSSRYDEHDRFMDQVDLYSYQWIYAELCKEHLEDIAYVNRQYPLYHDAVNHYLNETDEIEKTQKNSVKELVSLTGLGEKRINDDLKDQYDRLIHMDPEKLKEEMN